MFSVGGRKKIPLQSFQEINIKKKEKKKRKGKERKNKEKRKWCLGLLVIAMWISKEISPNCGD